MVRPIAVIGFSYSAALLAVFFFSDINVVTAGIILVIISAISISVPVLRKTGYIPTAALSALAAVITLFVFNSLYVNNTDILMENEVRVKAVICDLPYEKNNRVYYKIETSEIDFPDCPQKTKILVSSPKALRAEPFDTIDAKVKIYSRSEKDRTEDIAKGNFLKGSLDVYENVKITHNQNKPLYYYALMLRKSMENIISRNFRKEESSFITALFIGDKISISYEQNAVFRNAGITHIIVASGFHLAVLSGFITVLLMFLLRCRENTASLICVIFIFVYMATVGFTPSIMRAGIMTIITLIGKFLFRQSDSLTSLGIAVFIICFFNPYAVCDAGFLLSVSATLGIILLSGKLTDKLFEFFNVRKKSKLNNRISSFYINHEKLIKTVISSVTVPVSAMLFTIPVTIICFKFFAPYSIAANLMITFAASVLLNLVFLLIVSDVSVIFRFLTLPLAVICALITKYILWAAEFIGTLPYAGIRASYEYVPAALVLTLAVGVLYHFTKSGNRKRTVLVIVMSAVLFFISGNIIDIMFKKDSTKVSVLDVGNGISVVLTYGEESAVLYSGGSYDKISEIMNYLSETSCTDISYFLITDKTSQSSAYAEKLISSYNVETVQIYDEEKYYERVHRLVDLSETVILSSSKEKKITKFSCCNTEICIYKTDECNAVYFDTGEKRYLICQDGTDCTYLPEELLECEYLIISGKLKDSQKIRAEKIIISDVPSKIEEDINDLHTDYSKIYYTAGSGNIGIRSYPDGKTVIRRENDWLS